MSLSKESINRIVKSVLLLEDLSDEEAIDVLDA